MGQSGRAASIAAKHSSFDLDCNHPKRLPQPRLWTTGTAVNTAARTPVTYELEGLIWHAV